MFEAVQEFFRTYIPLKIQYTDIIEIVILSAVMYEVLVWIKTTRAWSLLKGITVLLVFSLMAYLLELNTILWLVESAFNVGVIAVVVIFQPELRKALEQLGRKKFIAGIFNGDTGNEGARFSDRTVNELVKAAYELSKTKTGALIVIEQEISLAEYERTGIEIDALITSQLLINIFEHNTPLHDGAVVVRGDRVVAATCYLPLSDNMDISKELGTRHRAAVGVSEVTDSFTIIVSEETGAVSVAIGGKIIRNIDGDKLKQHLIKIQNKQVDVKKFRLWRAKKQ
ncbi:MAG: diadenylate cyclase CdaA [Lachnospiraceae bacterium]